MGLLSKVGCNAGRCHGSFQGKSGFRLSLFGYEPAMDFADLTRDNLGRRVNVVKPDESLLLLEGAPARSPHEGGMRFGKDVVGVQRLPRVDRAAGRSGRPAAATIAKLEVTPGRLRRRSPTASRSR